MKRCTLFVLAVLIAGISGTRLGAQEAFYRPKLTDKDLEAAVGTHWYGLYLKDKKIGYCKSSGKRAGDTVVESFAMNMKLVSFEMKIEIKISQSKTFEAKPPYRLLEAFDESDDGTAKTRTAVKRSDK